MIIWQGAGILVIFTAGLGVVFFMLSASLFPSSGGNDALVSALRAGGGAAVAFLANWLLCKFLYRGGDRILIDSATGERIRVAPKHSVFFVPLKWFTVLFALAIPMAGWSGWTQGKMRMDDIAKYPGFHAFEKADASFSLGAINSAHGNTPEAVNAAISCSEICAKMRAEFFRMSRSGKALPDRDFQVYCLQTKEGALYLVNVPDLSKYRDADAKEGLRNMVWVAAQTASAEALKLPQQTPMGAGIRGAGGSYDTVLLGRVSQGPVSTTEGMAGTRQLYEWFDPARALPATGGGSK